MYNISYKIQLFKHYFAKIANFSIILYYVCKQQLS